MQVIRPEDLSLRGPGRALSESLECQLIARCAREGLYRIEALALDADEPQSLADLREATRGECHPDDTRAGRIYGPDGPFDIQGERIPVWSGASTRTIWSGPRVNYLFRAWHDSVHLLLGADFDPAGELDVARYQCREIHGSAERALLWIETAGQVQYHAAHGAFPSNQRRFVIDALRFGLETSIGRGLYHRVT